MNPLENLLTADELTPFVWALLLVPFLMFIAYQRMQTYMMFYQQEEYDSPRFIRWLQHHRAWDRQASMVLLAAVLMTILGQYRQMAFLLDFSLVPVVLAFALAHKRSQDNVRSSKKPLVRTERVRRINRIATLILLSITGAFVIAACFLPNGTRLVLEANWGSLLSPFETLDWRLTGLYLVYGAVIQLVPFVLMVGNKLLEPYESRVQAKFLKEAREKFNQLNPTVIAITGSFGKTSSKHILQHILSAVHPTLATPGSVNTEMGITRVIREQLSEDHRYFIVEMGAYGPGSIARLCRLTPPDVGLITAVGPAHYERFKTLETVSHAKFELAAATAANQASRASDQSVSGQAVQGTVVVNADGIPAELLSDRIKDVPANYIKVGSDGDISLAKVQQKADGLHLTLLENKEDATAQEHQLFVPLHGPHQVENIVSAVAVARALGLPFSIIRASLKSLPQIRHRTEVDRSGPVATVNDAYNSNPIGFEGALIALNAVVESGGRRILVTPGMVELGAKHDSEHNKLGIIAAQKCDVILVVSPLRIPTFVDGIKSVKNDALTLIEYQTQSQAEDWVRQNVRAGDAVLYENNLPDLYESPPRF